MENISLKDVLQNQELLRDMLFNHLEKKPAGFKEIARQTNMDEITVRRFMLNGTKITSLTVQKFWKWLQDEHK